MADVSLYVRVRNEQGQSLSGEVEVSWQLPGPPGGEHPGSREGELHLLEVPERTELNVTLKRPQAPQLDILLNVSLAPARRFVRGRPHIMHLHREWVRDQSGTRHRVLVLTVTWYEPQEVIICSGGDKKNFRRFIVIAYRRFSRGMVRTRQATDAERRAGILYVNPSCVLTLFEFQYAGSNHPSRRHHFLWGRGRRDVPGTSSGRARVVLMRTEQPASPLSITHVYEYLRQAGNERPGKVMALEFASHAYWMGPCLVNTNRAPWWRYCSEHCRTQRAHRHRIVEMPMASLAAYHTFDHMWVGRRHRYHYRRVARGPVDVAVSASSPQRQERDSDDRDPRNTDFSDGMKFDHRILRPDGIMSETQRQNMRRALHANAILRVWGCANGEQGPRWRAAAAKVRRANLPGNQLVTVGSRYHPLMQSAPGQQAQRQHIRQTWKVRRKDLLLMYLSRARRNYAQAIATALGRPCYSALPGTWSETAKSSATARLKGMRVKTTTERAVRHFTRRLPGFTDKDEAGYYRYNPTPPPFDVNIKVLVTGFVPYWRRGRLEPTNAAECAVDELSRGSVLGSVNVPRWARLHLTEAFEPQVDVVWAGGQILLRRRRIRRSHRPRVRGGQGIQLRTRQLDADIVVIVGEARSLLEVPVQQGGRRQRIRHDFRIERWARNRGHTRANLWDNDGFTLAPNTPSGPSPPDEIFPGEPYCLESTVPLYTWARMRDRLGNAGYRVHAPNGRPSMVNTAGMFVCNESFYHLLRESTTGQRPSGRWITMVHVAADRSPHLFVKLAQGLRLIVQTLVEDMLWATEIYGRQIPFEPARVLPTGTP